jgi:hypothetical protein
MSWLSSIFIRTPSTPTTDLTTIPQKLAFSGNGRLSKKCSLSRLELRPHRRCWLAGPDVGGRWPSWLVATAAEERLKFLNVLRYAHWVAAYWVLILLLASFVSSFVNWLLNQETKK